MITVAHKPKSVVSIVPENKKGISIPIPPKYKRLIQRLVDKGYYESISDFGRKAIDDFILNDHKEGDLLDQLEAFICGSNEKELSKNN